MDRLDETDSLEKEIQRMGGSKGAGFRPNTTGEMDVKTTMKMSKRSHNPDSYDNRLARSGGGNTRPHAPMQSRRGSIDASVAPAEALLGVSGRAARAEQRRAGGQSKKTRKKKSDSMADQWKGLKEFSRVSSTRSLREQVLSLE
jgi:hypothetical protein